MSDHPGPDAGTERQQAPDAGLIRRQQAIAQLDRSLNELARQQAQLQQQIAGYERQAQLARQGDQEHLVRLALEQRQRLYPYLLGLQQQIEQLRRQRASLIGPAGAPLAQTGVLPGAEGQAGQAALPPGNGMVKQPRSKQRRRALALVLFGLVALTVLAPLALLLTRHSSAPVAQKAAISAKLTPAPTFTPTPGPQQPFFTPAGTAPSSRDCQAARGILCYSPEQMQQAFRLNTLYHEGYNGSGQTIVILGTGKTTTLQSDLHTFDLAWGLPDPHFTILHPFGAPVPYTCPGGEDALQIENTLDVEWSHAIAPGATITLVIGSNDSGGPPEYNCSFAGLVDTFTYAMNHHLGSIISMSYGGSELGGIGETSSEQAGDKTYYNNADQLFQQAAAQGITVLASAGDQGATNSNDPTNPTSVWNQPNVAWPASDPYVLAVGGTTLSIQDVSGNYGSEVAWNDSEGATGGGLSTLFGEPAYQQTMPNQKLLQGMRGVPDVSFPAAVNYALYGSFAPGDFAQTKPQWTGWQIIGGTSAAAPCWAGLIAITDQLYGGPVGFIQPALYSLLGQGMHDITKGNNTLDGVQGYQALPGYDLVTGWGTPIADQLLPALVQEIDHLATGCGSIQRKCQ